MHFRVLNLGSLPQLSSSSPPAQHGGDSTVTPLCTPLADAMLPTKPEEETHLAFRGDTVQQSPKSCV